MAADVDDLLATMVAPLRPVPTARALALVRERYGFEPEATRLTGERDENFRLTAADGAQYVLKIANPAESAAETDFQTAALLHIEQADPTLPCPRVRRERTGGAYVRFLDEGGAERTVRLLTYLPGKLLGAARRSPRQRAACGEIGARLALALRGFGHPAADRKILWDLRHTGHMRSLLGELPRFPFGAEAARLIERLASRIDSELPPLRQQVVHNDLNPLNILVDPARREPRDRGDRLRRHDPHRADRGRGGGRRRAHSAESAATRPKRATAVLDVASAYHERVPLLRRGARAPRRSGGGAAAA